MAKPRNPSRARRQKAWKWGTLAESLTALAYRLMGYKILARRYKSSVGELDIVARRNRSIVFIEVKFRTDHAAWADAIAEPQRRRISSAAQAFIATNPRYQHDNQRIDVVMVAPATLPRRVKYAW